MIAMHRTYVHVNVHIYKYMHSMYMYMSLATHCYATLTPSYTAKTYNYFDGIYMNDSLLK